MKVPFSPVHARFGQDLLDQEGYVVERAESGLNVISGEVFTLSDETNESLSLCFGTHLQHCALLRTGPINTLTKAREFLTLAYERHKILSAQHQKLQRKPRIVCSQLDDPLNEWEMIRLQHVNLAAVAHERKLEFHVIHLSFPTAEFFENPSTPPRTPFQKKNVEKLTRELNWLGWLKYGLWIAEEMEVFVKQLQHDAANRYQIDALCREFIQEARSVLLLKHMTEVHELSLKYADLLTKRSSYAHDPHHPHETHQLNQRIVELEKDLFKSSLFLKDSLKRLLEIVLKMESEGNLKDKLGESYYPIRRMSLLYRKILQSQIDPESSESTNRTSWSQQGMLRILLDDELMVVSSVNSMKGTEKTHLAYSMNVATLELKHKFSADRVIDMAFNWISLTVKLNRRVVEQGFDVFKSWLKSPVSTDELHLLHRRAQVIEKFRKIFFRVLMDFCLPIQQLTPHQDKEPSLHADRSFLNLFPSHLDMKYDDGERESIPYVVYDYDSGEPRSLSERGIRALSRLL